MLYSWYDVQETTKKVLFILDKQGSPDADERPEAGDPFR